MSRTIGIARALDAYRYLDRWCGFLASMGQHVVVTEPTTRQTVELGARIAPAELCLPVKAFLGHVLELVGRVDALFLPRVVCQRSATDLLFACPKSLALPDLARALIPGLEDAVELVLDERSESEERSYERLARRLGSRYRRQGGVQRGGSTEPAAGRQGPADRGRGAQAADGGRPRPGSVPVRVGVIGHPYLLNDRVLSLDLLARLAALGAETRVPQFAQRPDVRLDKRFRTNWLFEVELVDAAGEMARDGVDGLLLASSFACGTSAVTSEIIRRDVAHARSGLPVLQVFFDEHSAEAGLATRLESFVELLRMRR